MSVPDVRRCRFCQCSSQSDLCDTCFPVWSELEERGGLEPVESEYVCIESEFAPVWDLVREVAPALAREDPALWLEELVDLLCSRYGLNELSGELDLFAQFDELFESAVKKFASELGANDLFQLGRFQQGSKCLHWLGAKLRGPKFERPAAPEAQRAQETPRARPAPVARAPVEAAPVVARGRSERLTPFALLQALPTWADLLPASRAVFTVVYRRADRSGNEARPWCQVSVGLLVKATGYSERQVKRGLAELRRGGWIGYVVRGRPKIGASRYWVVTSPAQLGVRLSTSVLSEIAFKP